MRITETYKEDYVNEVVSLYKRFIVNVRDMKLSKNVDGITHRNIVPFATYAPWVDDLEFNKIYTAVKDHTMVDIYKCYGLWSFVKRNRHLKGDILEVGVWRGGSGCILAKSAQLYSNCRVYLADTFSGVVKSSEHDPIYKGGEHSDTNVNVVEDLANKLGLKNVEILIGLFPDEIKMFETKNIRLKLCHIDVDTYKSAKDIFYYVWPHMQKGGAVIFDDYGFWGCEGVTKLGNEIDEKDATFIYNLNGHAIFIKL